MKGFFFYCIGISIASGILFRSFFVIDWWVLSLLFLISISSGLLWWMRTREYHSPLFILGLMLFCFTLGVVRFDISDTVVSPLEERVGEAVALDGIVTREPEIRETSVHLYIKINDTDEIILVTTDRFKPFAYGDMVHVEGLLKKPASFETEYGRTFNYPGYLKAKRVQYTVSFAKVEVLSQGSGNWFFTKLFIGKQKFIDSLELAIPEPEAGLGLGLLLGVKRALGDKLEKDFRTVGIIHIVVLSGYNIMIVAEAIMRLLSAVFRPYTRMVIGIVSIFCFAVLVGLSATVVRASLMAVLVLFARTTGRQYEAIRALMFACVVMLLFNPYLLAFDPGFQLSFLATLGLILLSPIIEKRLIRVPTKFQIREFLTATLSTQIFLLPFLVFLIGTFSFVSIIVNILILPLVPITMFLSFIAGCAGFITDYLGMLFGYPAYIALMYIITVAEQFAQLPFASFVFSTIPFWAVSLMYLGMAIGLTYLYAKEAEPKKFQEIKIDENYDDWTIEEEKETPPERQGLSGGVHDPLPFR